MSPYEASTDMNATPETIWETCFASMNWETFLPDVIDVVRGDDDDDVGCRDGAKWTLVMKDTQSKFTITLSDVVRNQSVSFAGSFGIIGTNGTFRIGPVTSTTSRVDFL